MYTCKDNLTPLLYSGKKKKRKKENNLKTDLDDLSSKFQFLILYDLVNFGNVIEVH